MAGSLLRELGRLSVLSNLGVTDCEFCTEVGIVVQRLVVKSAENEFLLFIAVMDTNPHPFANTRAFVGEFNLDIIAGLVGHHEHCKANERPFTRAVRPVALADCASADYGVRQYQMDSQSVNSDALAWIGSYARCELSLDELCSNVRRAVGKRFIHNPHYRVVNLNQICPNRAVRITPERIEILFTKRRQGEITERQMVDWAHMTTINEVYYWEPEDAAVVAKWVNFLIFDLKPENPAA